MVEGNGKNRFWIEVKCPYQVLDEEWASILLILNLMLQSHQGGRFRNVGAYLCEQEENEKPQSVS